MRFFNLDCHISVIADVRNILQIIDPTIEIVDWSLSGHTFVMGKERANPLHINANTFMSLNLSMIEGFHHEYDEFLSGFDGFIACHPVSFAMLYAKYNKPVIVVNSCRYDIPFCWSKNMAMRHHLQQCLRDLSSRGLLYLVSNNKADAGYLKHDIPIEHPVIPSLCLYTNMRYNPRETVNKILCYSGGHLFVHNRVEKKQPGFKWSDLMRYKGIVHFPYEVSTMSIFEHYSSGIPLIFPSKRLLKEMWESGTNKLQSISAYWGRETLDKDYWLNNADFYDEENMKYVYFFDSPAELFRLLDNFNEPEEVFNARMEWIEKRKNAAIGKWKNIVSFVTHKVDSVN